MGSEGRAWVLCSCQATGHHTLQSPGWQRRRVSSTWESCPRTKERTRAVPGLGGNSRMLSIFPYDVAKSRPVKGGVHNWSPTAPKAQQRQRWRVKLTILAACRSVILGFFRGVPAALRSLGT